MPKTALTRAYLVLLGLSTITTVLTELRPQAGTLFVILVLSLAGLKARTILAEYLNLRSAPHWARGFNAFLLAFMLAAFGLYLAG